MIKMSRLFPGGKKKALTLSYDDGVFQDKRLVEIFNKYNLKATFNLNSGLLGEEGSFVINDLTVRRLGRDEAVELYKGHEIAVHGLTHMSLTDIPREFVIKEVLEDRKNHERMVGYPVKGMAYPNGVYNKEVFKVLEDLGINYSRTVNNQGDFSLPLNFLEWNPTAHHNNPHLTELAKSFAEGQFGELAVFYLWGHSYEFDLDNNWQLIEEFSKYISGREDIWYATNIQIIDYLAVLDRLEFSANLDIVHNPSATSAWILFNGAETEIKAGEIVKLA